MYLNNMNTEYRLDRKRIYGESQLPISGPLVVLASLMLKKLRIILEITTLFLMKMTKMVLIFKVSVS